MADEANTTTTETAPGHTIGPSLRTACVGFLSSTLGLTIMMVLLSHA